MNDCHISTLNEPATDIKLPGGYTMIYLPRFSVLVIDNKALVNADLHLPALCSCTYAQDVIPIWLNARLKLVDRDLWALPIVMSTVDDTLVKAKVGWLIRESNTKPRLTQPDVGEYIWSFALGREPATREYDADLR